MRVEDGSKFTCYCWRARSTTTATPPLAGALGGGRRWRLVHLLRLLEKEGISAASLPQFSLLVMEKVGGDIVMLLLRRLREEGGDSFISLLKLVEEGGGDAEAPEGHVRGKVVLEDGGCGGKRKYVKEERGMQKKQSEDDTGRHWSWPRSSRPKRSASQPFSSAYKLLALDCELCDEHVHKRRAMFTIF